jgi:hypothetical protein
MPDEPTASDWLPPRTPDGQPAPQFESTPPDAEPEPEAEQAVDPWPHPVHHPVFTAKKPERTNGLATTSLVLGILGLLIVIPTLGAGFLFSLPCSIAAWVIGAQGRNRVAAGVTGSGDGTAHAGLILGIVGVVIGVIGAIVWIVLISAGLDLEELRRDLQSDR